MFGKQSHQKTVPVSKGLRIAIVAARYNGDLADALLDSALKVFLKKGVKHVRVFRVPGSYEIPVVAAKIARGGKHDAIVALGVVFQGKTSHAEHITAACAINLQRIAMETGVPVVHQVLTPRNLHDASVRVRIRGREAAETAVEMAVTMKNIKSSC